MQIVLIGEEVPDLVRKLMQDLQWITCDRLRRAEEGAMPGLWVWKLGVSHHCEGTYCMESMI